MALYNGKDSPVVTFALEVELEHWFFCPSVLGSKRRMKYMSGHYFKSNSTPVKGCGWPQSLCRSLPSTFLGRVLLAPFCLGSHRFQHSPDPQGHSVDMCGFIQVWLQRPTSPHVQSSLGLVETSWHQLDPSSHPSDQQWTIRSQIDSPCPSFIQAGILWSSSSVPSGYPLHNPHGHELTVLLAVLQVHGQCSQPFGIFPFPTSV